MDSQTIIAVVAILAMAGVIIVLSNRGKGKSTTRITGPAGTSLETTAEDPRPGSASVTGSKAGGNIESSATTGGDASVSGSEAGGDISAHAGPESDPKA